MLGFTERNFKCKASGVMLSMCNSWDVRPHLEYAMPCWAHCYKITETLARALRRAPKTIPSRVKKELLS